MSGLYSILDHGGIDEPRPSRFRWILAGSVAAHALVMTVFVATYLWGLTLKFGSISFEDTGEEAHYKVAMIDRTKPLILPKGFFAIVQPPEKKPEPERKRDDGKAEKADDKKADDKGKDDETKPGGTTATVDPTKFGKINTRSLKPHIQQIYAAYEQGRLTVTSFTVTVSCKALPDGSLGNIQIARSSGDPLIDETALNLFRELSDMHALAPLSELSSLSMSFEKTPTTAALVAVGFADDPSVTNMMALQLQGMKFLARKTMANPDQTQLLENTQISSSGNRVSVRLELSKQMAGEMMRRSFANQQAKAGT